jgi:hypothetical protein
MKEKKCKRCSYKYKNIKVIKIEVTSNDIILGIKASSVCDKCFQNKVIIITEIFNLNQL